MPAALLELQPHVRNRVGVDLDPVDVTTDEGALRLRSFVWPGQEGRLERLDQAIEAVRRCAAEARRRRSRWRRYRSFSPRATARCSRSSSRPRSSATCLDDDWERVCHSLAEAGRDGIACLRLDCPAGGRRPRLLGTVVAAMAGRGTGARGARRLPRCLARVARVITSRTNPTLKLVRKLLAQKRKRAELGLFVVEGEDLVEAARAAGIEPVELLVAGETVEAELLAELSTLPHPARAIGVYRQADLPRERAGDDARALARGGSGQRRHAAAHGGRVRGGCRSLGRLRRPARPEGAARVGRARSSAFRCCALEDAPKPWIALAAHGGRPLQRTRALRSRHLPPGRGARGAAGRAGGAEP